MRWQSVAVVWLAVIVAGCVAEGESTGQNDAGSGPNPRDLPPPDENEARIIGTVTDDSLAPIAGAQVGIIDSDPQIVVTTGADGRFALVGLSSGTYTLGFQQLGYTSVTRQVEAQAGQTAEVSVALVPIAVETGESRYFTVIGDGYFACGAHVWYVVGSLAWGNLHACVFDNHKPNISFEASKMGLGGIMDEVMWSQSSGLTSQRLAVSLGYRQVCNPFCSNAATWDSDDGYGDSVSASPVRFYVPFDDEEKEKVEEDPMPLKSITFPNRDDQPAVIVFQQRMTHYITMFWGPPPADEEGMMEAFTAIPDQ